MTNEKAMWGDLFGFLADFMFLMSAAAFGVLMLIARPDMSEMAVNAGLALLTVTASGLLSSAVMRTLCRLLGGTYQMIPERIDDWCHTSWRGRVLQRFWFPVRHWGRQQLHRTHRNVLEPRDNSQPE